jgi:Sulfotransferase family
MSHPPADVDARSRRPKVIYVMGAGRSGSTILGVSLGNCSDVFFAGELDKWLARSGAPKLKDAARVELWEEVRARTGDSQELFGGRAHRYLERSSALFRAGRRRARKRLRDPYLRAMGSLYEAIASSAQASYIVDTSHYPLRARELQSLHDVELYILLLVRDPSAVVASFAKDDVAERQFNATTTRAYLLLTYLLSAWVFLNQPRERRLLLHYEDLLEDPAGVIREVLERVGSCAELPDPSALRTGTALHGNRLLEAEVVSLQRPLAPAASERLHGRLFARVLLGSLDRLRPRVTPRQTAG